jgi:hydroxymethylbilane synthase
VSRARFGLFGEEAHEVAVRVTEIRVATRPSRLAVAQTRLAIERLEAVMPGARFEVVPIESEGDARASEPLRTFGDKAVFVSAVQEALIDGRADIAVHSLKDLPLETSAGLWQPCFLPREDPRDVLISTGRKLAELLPGSRVGTSSPRRIGQMSEARPDLEFVDIRGNVDTRLRGISSGDYDAIVLAAAGLNRLGLEDRITEFLSPDLCTPAPGQGIVAIECRASTDLGEDLTHASDRSASFAAIFEREVARLVGATCTTAFGCLAEMELPPAECSPNTFRVRAWMGVEGEVGQRIDQHGSLDTPHGLAQMVARGCLRHGASPRARSRLR